jgi:SAM-dependent methyltransferase
LQPPAAKVKDTAMEEAEYARLAAVEDRHWWYRGMRQIADQLLGDAGGQLLDAGCGTGANLQHLAARGRAVGVEIADAALRYCRARGVTAVKGSLESLPFADASFDCVTSFDVLYHRRVRSDRRALAELARVLRPGGTLLVRVPALELLRRRHDDAVHTRERYTRGLLVRRVVGAGLRVVRATYCNSLLLPLVGARAFADRLQPSTRSDLAPLAPRLERWFRACLSVEAALLAKTDLPLGASVCVLARR